MHHFNIKMKNGINSAVEIHKENALLLFSGLAYYKSKNYELGLKAFGKGSERQNLILRTL